MADPDSRQDDIEIYVRTKDNKAIAHWLASVFSHLDINANESHTQHGNAQLDSNTPSCDILLLNNAVKGFTCIWFKQNHTPWSNDVDCARSAWGSLHCEVRASLGSWAEGAEEDLFLRINADGESETSWRT